MAKGQRRSNREAKKPKQPKAERSAPSPLGLTTGSATREGGTVGGSGRNEIRNDRR